MLLRNRFLPIVTLFLVASCSETGNDGPPVHAGY